MSDYQRCKLGLWDTSILGINFDKDGVSNYAKMQLSLMEQYPKGKKGQSEWENIVKRIKVSGKSKKYDCIVGVSGGTDSSYLLHLAKQYGLRVLAVNLDNGWNSNIAVKNIKSVTSALNYDLETYVINYEEVVAVLKSYIKAALPWIDSPTDIAIKAILYKIAKKEGIKYILNGSDFRSEGKQPLLWTYSDTKQMKYVVKKFTNCKLKTFPLQPITSWLYYGIIRKIKVIRPLYFLDYEKKKAKIELCEKYGWSDYGGHHYENIFTKFSISYWLFEKFGIDKRIITFSAQVLSGELKRDKALKMISEKPYSQDTIKEDKAYIIKKLRLNDDEFKKAFNADNKYYYDYPSYYPTLRKYSKAGKLISDKIFGFKPGIFEAIDHDI